MSAVLNIFFCGSDCVEDVNRSGCHLRESTEVRIPTSHIIGRAIKEVSHEDLEYKPSSDNECAQIHHLPKTQRSSDEIQYKDESVQIRLDCQRGFRSSLSSKQRKAMRNIRTPRIKK